MGGRLARIPFLLLLPKRLGWVALIGVGTGYEKKRVSENERTFLVEGNLLPPVGLRHYRLDNRRRCRCPECLVPHGPIPRGPNGLTLLELPPSVRLDHVSGRLPHSFNRFGSAYIV
ncbi:hypothetical protein EDB87DRAFT_295868 [Lactarius vividus]|nr:hypothetical protein EDB87DRAFT_295868 [Lactarius vividus]